MAAMRRDGQATYDRLLEAATVVFAERGYRHTTVAAIAQAAGSQAAAVNYHFGSKEQLYAKVWRAAFDRAQAVFPLDGGLTVADPASERLRVFVHAVLNRILSLGQLGCAGQILLAELSDPTEAIDMVRLDALEPILAWIRGILQDLLGPRASQEVVSLCLVSIMNQCLALGFRRGKVPPPFRDLDPRRLKECLADHIVRFSLAGIEAVRRDVESGGQTS